MQYLSFLHCLDILTILLTSSQDSTGVLEVTDEGVEVLVARLSFVPRKSQIWAKEETFRVRHGQRTQPESEAVVVGMDLKQVKVSKGSDEEDEP